MCSRECENGQDNPCGQKEEAIEMEKEEKTKSISLSPGNLGVCPHLGAVLTFSPFHKMKIELEKAQKMEGRIIIISLGNTFSIEIFLNGLKILKIT